MVTKMDVEKLYSLRRGDTIGIINHAGSYAGKNQEDSIVVFRRFQASVIRSKLARPQQRPTDMSRVVLKKERTTLIVPPNRLSSPEIDAK